MSNSKNFGLEDFMEESKYYLQQQYDSMEVIKKSIRDFITSSGVVISFLSLIQIGINKIELFKLSNKGIFMLAAIILYLAMIVISLFLLSPREMFSPIKMDLDSYKKFFLGKSKKLILDKKLKAYMNVIDKNRPILKCASLLSKICSIIYILIIIFVIASFLI